MKALNRLVLLVSLLTLSACSQFGGGTQGDDVAVDDRSSSSNYGTDDGGAATSSAMGSDTFDGRPLNSSESSDPMDRWVVYFDFDSSSVSSENNAMLGAHAAYLIDHPELSLRLEGYSDERGTREYNIGLGDRRAQAVLDVLTLQGAPGHQIKTVSYGEESPEALGHNEEAWRLNRRVVLVYTN